MLVLNGIFIAHDLWSAFSVYQDMNAINRQKGLLEAAFSIVEESGYVSSQYRNPNDIGAIVNFISQGINNTTTQISQQ